VNKKIRNDKGFIVRFLQIVLIVAILTLLLKPFQAILGLVNISMMFLLPVLYSAVALGRRAAIVSAVLGVLFFDFFFVPPPLSLTVDDLRYLLSFLIFIIVGVLTGTLASSLQHQVVRSRQREANMTALYALSREISAVAGLDNLLAAAAIKVAESIECQVIIMMPDEKTGFAVKASFPEVKQAFIDNKEWAVVTWVYQQRKLAGKGTDTLGDAERIYLPLLTEQGIVGVLGVQPAIEEIHLSAEQRRLLEAFASLIAVAINRVQLAEKARANQLLMESERLYTVLFDCVSHDLKTPLSSILGAVTTLLSENEAIQPDDKLELLQAIKRGTQHMNRLVNNLLDMARLESGSFRLSKEWCDVQDLISVAVRQIEPSRDKKVILHTMANLPLVKADFILIEQVIINLLDNAFKYSRDNNVEISVHSDQQEIRIAVIDNGLGLPEEDLERIFDKFYRIKSTRQVSGTGLGLTICKSIVEAHGGRIWAKNNPHKGMTITFTLPVLAGLSGEIPLVKDGEENGE